jgi:hypothetical protein
MPLSNQIISLDSAYDLRYVPKKRGLQVNNNVRRQVEMETDKSRIKFATSLNKLLSTTVMRYRVLRQLASSPTGLSASGVC